MSLENFIKLENKEAVIADLNDIEVDVQAAVIEELREAGQKIKNGLKDSFPMAQHMANMAAYDQNGYMRSVPGGIPFSQTGNLKESIYAKMMPLMLGEPISIKISTFGYAFYGHILEFGSSKMPARPWFYSGIAKAIPSLKGRVERMLEKVIKKRNDMRPKYIRRGKMTMAEAGAQYKLDLAKLYAFKSGS